MVIIYKLWENLFFSVSQILKSELQCHYEVVTRFFIIEDFYCIYEILYMCSPVLFGQGKFYLSKGCIF